MVRLETIRESNAKAKQLKGIVAVFVGGTGGIGENTARELFTRTTAPKAYIIGRSSSSALFPTETLLTVRHRDETKGNTIVNQLKELNPDGEAYFLQKDISLLRNVDELCEEILKREPKINCLFLTAGYLTLSGRTETVEGIDRKMSVNYYSRVRWMMNLMPALTAASDRNELSRVITVLAAGSEGDVRMVSHILLSTSLGEEPRHPTNRSHPSLY